MGKRLSSPTMDLQKIGLDTSSSFEDEVQVSAAEAVPNPQASFGINSQTGIMQLGNDTSQAAGKEVLAGDPIAAAAPLPGFVETKFSCGKNRYFYKEQDASPKSGSFGVVRMVYWHDSATPAYTELELFVVKSLDIARSHTHRNGLSSWQASIFREAAALRYLAGVPGVPEFWDLVTEPDGTMHIIMERGPGVNLDMRMESRHLAGCGLSWQEIRSVLRHLGQVLAHCHERGLVHGDIKPDNIITDEGCHVTLVDFGMADIWDGSSWEHHGETIQYLAPELLLAARVKRPIDYPPLYELHGPPVDCWAYGIVAMELLTGCSLFKPDYRAMPPHIESEIERDAWSTVHIASLHGQWEAQPESSAIHATFQERVELLAAASEDYKRAGTDFLRRLLDPNPNNRMTAQDAVRHPFLTGAFPEVAANSMPAKVEGEVELMEAFIACKLQAYCAELCKGIQAEG